MKLTYKIIITLSLIINLVFIYIFFSPKLFYLGSINDYDPRASRIAWWFVKWMNFNESNEIREAYNIFWNLNMQNNKFEYFYINRLWNRWWLSTLNLKPLSIKSESEKELILEDSTYEFTITKNKDIPVIWKDRNNKIFTLWYWEFYWF